MLVNPAFCKLFYSIYEEFTHLFRKSLNVMYTSLVCPNIF